MSRIRPFPCVPALLFAALATDAGAQELTVNVPCAADATLYEALAGNISNGGGMGVFVGLNGAGQIRRALLRFNVAALVPAGARVLSATLNLNVAQSTVAANLPVTGHRVLQAWNEGTVVAAGNGGGGGTAAVGDSTWLHTSYATAFWTTPGGDFAPVPSLTMSMPPFGVCSSDLSQATATDVQSWLDNPAQNFGWLLKMDELLASTAHRIDSKESAGIKPTLTVVYLPMGNVTTWGTGCPSPLGTFQTSILGVPAGGNTVAVVKTGAPPLSIGGDIIAYDFDPVGIPLGGCSLNIPLAGYWYIGDLFLTDAAGNGATAIFIPPGFPGFLGNIQPLVLDNSPLGFTFSNAALLCTQ